MKKISVNQFHSGTAFGDAITNSMFFIQKLLKSLGFESEIYCENLHPDLTDKIFSYKSYKSDCNNILLFHLSLGFNVMVENWLSDLEDKIILVYHNITPSYYFPKDNPFYYYSLKGRKQLEFFKEKAIGAICDSEYNANDLISSGFKSENIRVIPLLLDYGKIVGHQWSHWIFDRYSDTFNILFVGRIAPNKAQLDLIETFNFFSKICDRPARLFLVGGKSLDSYYEKIVETIEKYNLQDKVILTGVVSSEDLYAYYRVSDVFLCLSEHEGFCVPLIESMIFDIPVVAYESSNIKNTLDGAGALFKEKNIHYIAGFLSILSKNKRLRREIIKKQRETIYKYQNNYLKSLLAQFLSSLYIDIDPACQNLSEDTTREQIKFQIEGSFDSSYSLAILNREMARALNKLYNGRVSLYSTEGNGDFAPDTDFLQKNPDIKKMWSISKKAQRADVVLRNLYPPRIYDLKGLTNMMNSYGWEESVFPKEYVNHFNTYLDCLPVMSGYVKKVMIDNGITIPVHIVGIGVDHLLHKETGDITLKTKKKFKFLHISSCFPRKGIDVLLEVYCNSFSINDSVCLVIKTFPNPHNNIKEQIDFYQNRFDKCPEIELIDFDISDNDIISLYKNCDCLVAPGRGEGFGLPIAEAMLFDLPVITTKFGGQTDFCADETAWLVDFSFQKTNTHFNLFDSCWAEPDKSHLARLMVMMPRLSDEQRKIKTNKAKEFILSRCKWEHCANKLVAIGEKIDNASIFSDKKPIKTGWISTWNTRCGIAEYSKFLISNFNPEIFDIIIFADKKENSQLLQQETENNVIRLWKDNQDKDLDRLYCSIKEKEINLVVIQFNFGFFNVFVFEEFIKKLLNDNINIFITFHSVKDINRPDFKASLKWICNTLKRVQRLFVHSVNDLSFLKDIGLIDNVALFPHGIQTLVSEPHKQCEIKKRLNISDKIIIASTGFLLPHKGIIPLIYAANELKKRWGNIHLLLINALYPHPVSEEYFMKCKKIIHLLGLTPNITMITDFLDEKDIIDYLCCADIVALPYQNTQESSSASVRFAISSAKPVICTPLDIFSDVQNVVHFTENETTNAIFEKIDMLLFDKNLYVCKNEIQKKWIEEHRWDVVAKRMQNILIFFLEIF